MMRLTSSVPAFDEHAAHAALSGLPEAVSYRVLVKPLRYRTEPHLSAVTVFDDRTITLRVPEPFFPFGEIVPYGAKRIAGDELRFVPLSEGISFRTRAEVVRFLYCHEWFHWYLYEIRGKGWSSETACDRFALRNYRRRSVTMADARAALRRTPQRTAGPVVRARAAKTSRHRRASTPPLPGLEGFFAPS